MFHNETNKLLFYADLRFLTKTPKSYLQYKYAKPRLYDGVVGILLGKRSLKMKFRIAATWLTLSFAMLGFQNCGGGFESGTLTDSVSNSSITPPVVVPPVVQPPGPDATERWTKAKAVIDAKCVSCHKSGGAAAFSLMTYTNEAGFVNGGLVVSGDIDKSKLMTRLTLYKGTTAGTRNMPMGSTLSQTEYDTLADWVSMMGMIAVDPNAGMTFFQCNPNADPAASHLTRLQKNELKNTFQDLMDVQAAADRTAIMTELNTIFTELPNDNSTQFERLNNIVSSQHINTQYKLATRFAALITNSSTRLTNLGGACLSVSPPTATCISDFVKNFGLKVYRRPLTTAEITLHTDFYNKRTTTKLADLIGYLIMSPEFFYHLENQGTSINGRADLARLTSYEVASKISYNYWNSMPNKELFDAAAAGKLGSAAGIKEVLDTVVFGTQIARTKASINEYFTQWLHLDNLSPLTNMSPDFLALTQGEMLNQPGHNHRADMLQEARDLINHYVWTEKKGYKELLTSNISFAKTDDLARIYGVPKWSGTGTPNITFPAGQRSGLLTRAALIISGGVENSPIATGVRITREVLCNELPAPPADVDRGDDEAQTMILTTRDKVHNITNKPACISCHSVINPIGFAFESYDAFGRYRTTGRQTIYSQTTGQVIADLPVSAAGEAQVILGRPQAVRDAVDLSSLIATSGKGEACFAKNYYRYSVRRQESDTGDGCQLGGLYDKLKAPTGGMQEMFKEIAIQPAFLMRKISQ